MANIKSAEKRIDIIKRNTAINKSRKTEIKTYINKFNVALDNNNLDEAKSLFRTIEKKLYRASTKSTFHKNTVSRKVSRLAKKLNKAV